MTSSRTEPVFVPQPAEGVTYADKITAADRSSTSPARPESSCCRVRALSPHIGARAELEGRPRDRLARPRRRGRRRLRAGRGATGGRSQDGVRRMAPRAAVDRARAAGGVRRPAPGLRGRCVCRPGTARRRSPGSTSAIARSPNSSRSAPSSGRARSTMRSRRSGSALCVGSTPPVRAALRLGAYQLVYLDGIPRYAAVNESVELVRARPPGTRGALRKCGTAASRRGRPRRSSRLCPRRRPSRPHSLTPIPTGSPRRGGATSVVRSALALMRAQNESVETAVRLVRGDDRRRAGHRDPGRVASSSGSTRQRSAKVASGHRVAGSQLAGLAVGAQHGERVLDVCAAPGGKATMLAGEVVAVEVNEARARELEENVRLLGATNVRGRPCRRARPAGRAGRLRSRARRRALLGSRRARRRDLICGGVPSRCPSFSSSSASGGCAGATGRDGALLGLHDQCGRERGSRGRVRLAVDGTSAEEWPQFRLRGGRSSCRRCRTSTEPAGSLSRDCACPPDPVDKPAQSRHERGHNGESPRVVSLAAGCGEAGAELAQLRPSEALREPGSDGPHRKIVVWPGASGSGTAGRSSRRSTRQTSCGSARKSSSCSRPVAGSSISTSATAHFVPPVTIGPVVLRSIAPAIHARRRGGRLPSDGG